MYWEMKRRTSEGIPVYQQSPLQSNVWDTLQGDKDDFLVYDRCGRLTFHIMLPFSILHYPYVEAAVRATYFQNICNCTLDSNSTRLTSSNVTRGKSFEQNPTTAESPNINNHHHHDHDHHVRHDHSRNRPSQYPAVTQTTSTAPVKKHAHPDPERVNHMNTP